MDLEECTISVWGWGGLPILSRIPMLNMPKPRCWTYLWPFPVLWPLLSFPICSHIECSTLTASSFRIWNSSTGIPSPPLALFIVMLPKAHLTSHSRMPGSRWVITPSWLSESWRSFLYSSSVYSCYLFLISSAPVRSHTLSVLYCAHLCMKHKHFMTFHEKVSFHSNPKERQCQRMYQNTWVYLKVSADCSSLDDIFQRS